jgi:transcriptional regulator with XRE-family HTH domain
MVANRLFSSQQQPTTPDVPMVSASFLGRAIRNRRVVAKRLTQEEFAVEVSKKLEKESLSQEWVSKIENGKIRMYVDQLAAISLVLGCKREELFQDAADLVKTMNQRDTYRKTTHR